MDRESEGVGEFRVGEWRSGRIDGRVERVERVGDGRREA